MNIPPKYEDVVAQLDAALAREAALDDHLDAALRQVKENWDYAQDKQQRLTVAERRESEAREELLDLSRKLDVFYSRSHGIKNLSAIEDANDKSKALQQRLTVAEKRLIEAHSREVLLQDMVTVAEQREDELEGLLREVANLDPRGEFLGWQLDGKIEAALKPAEEGEGS